MAENAEHATGGARKLQFRVGGAVPPQGHVYVRRPQDQRFVQLVREKPWTTVLGARTMGKSSLISNTRAQLESNACHVAYIDVEGQIGKPDSLTDWVRAFAQRLERSLRLPRGSVTTRTEDSEPAAEIEDALLRALAHLDGRLLVVLDEIDSITRLKFKDQVAAAFRSLLHEQAFSAEFSRISFCTLGLRPINELASPVVGTA